MLPPKSGGVKKWLKDVAIMGKLVRFLRRNYMVDTFLGLKGNPRACIWTEPLWGVPYNLYRPYVTRFMIALGLTMTDIGLVTTITYISQVISSVLSGVLTDKLGRRKCTVIFDVLSWSVPELIWVFSQNTTWFVVAALFNGLWRITENSWGLLMIEDADRNKIVVMYSLTSLMGVIAAFVAPFSKFAVDAYGLVPTMRVLYLITFISMTTKFIILFFFSRETEAGKQRMRLTNDKSIFTLLWECKDVYLKIIKEKRMFLTLGIMAVYSLINTVNDNCWATFVVDKLNVVESDLSWFAMIKGAITLGAIFALVPKLKRVSFKRPMLISLALFALSEAILMLMGSAQPSALAVWLLLVACVALEATAISLLAPLTSSLLFINADADERARVCGMVYATISLMVCVFPVAIGKLADISLYIPFGINLCLFAVVGALTVLISKLPIPE